jgi:type I restriction enzyme S subunit
MELSPGYKQTEVGVIPDDWDVVQLGDLKPFVTSGSRGWASFYSERGDLFVRITNLSRESIYLNLGDCKYVELPPEAREGIRTQLNEHDVLISITADIGIVGYVDAGVPLPAYINQHIALVRLDPTTTSGQFVSYFLASDQPQKLFRAATDTGAKAGMSLITVRKIQTALPPLPEQRAIAAALSGVDALLGGLDRLIAKKRDLKRAAMQQLLTGQTRLPGFHGAWEVTRLGDVATFHKGKGLPKSALVPYGSEPCVHYGELFTQYGETIRETISRTNKSPGELRSVANDVLMPTSDVTPRGLAKASCVIADNVVLGGDLLVIRTDPAVISGTFLSHVIRREDDQVLRLVTGSTVYHLYGADMKKFTFRLPQLAEQQAIVGVLAEMDAELSALEARRDKTRSLKQGMMQELLTGKTRLVRAGGANA